MGAEVSEKQFSGCGVVSASSKITGDLPTRGATAAWVLVGFSPVWQVGLNEVLTLGACQTRRVETITQNLQLP